MKLSDLYFSKKYKFSIAYDENLHLHPGEEITLSFPEAHFSRPGYFLLNEYQPVQLAPADAEEVGQILKAQAFNQTHAFFAVDSVENQRIYLQLYLVNFHQQYLSPLVFNCTSQLLQRKGREQLKKEYVCSLFGKEYVFALRPFDTAEQPAKKFYLFSADRVLLIEEQNNGWAAQKEIARKMLPVDKMAVLALGAPSVEFAENQQDAELTQKIKVLLQEAAQDDFLKLWNNYHNMEKALLEYEAAQVGYVEYTSYERNFFRNDKNLVFHLKEPFEGNKGKLSLGAIKDKADLLKGTADILPVGQLEDVRGSGKLLVTSLSEDEDFLPPPDQGFLILNQKGNVSASRRRERARQAIESGQCPIPYLKELINSGVAEPLHGPLKNLITETFRKRFPMAAKLNEEQRRALEAAICTPDIAVIKGPPGTGKTLVIRAIEERFKQNFEEEERKKQKEAQLHNQEYAVQLPKILKSSYQNGAVDNALKGSTMEDLPAFRVSSRPSKQYEEDLEKWVKNVCMKLTQQLQNPSYQKIKQQLETLRGQYDAFLQEGKPFQAGQALLQAWLDAFGGQISGEFKTKMAALLQRKEDAPSEQKTLATLLEGQRLHPRAFAEDDGKARAQKLLEYMILYPEEDFTPAVRTNILQLLRASSETANFNSLFQRFVADIENLKRKYAGVSPADWGEAVSQLISQLEPHVKRNLTDAASPHGLELSQAFILEEYLQHFQVEYKQLIQKYSSTIGATCQKAGGSDLKGQEFDLVIVDEAARANPLDLFIPLAKAKKVVLVGDQSQLTHMLCPEALERLKALQQQDQIAKLEESLFERLYKFLSAQQAQQLKVVELKKQFRYNQTICDFISRHFYNNQLTTGDIENWDKVTPKSGLYGNSPLAAVHIPLSQGMESRQRGLVSLSRAAEIPPILRDIRVILQQDPAATIGVITFYSAQSLLLSQAIEETFNGEENKRIFVGTVDSFQGEEYDYILLSAVRANPQHRVGFLATPNRLCVALSRAHKQMILYGDKETVSQIDCLKDLFVQFEKEAC